MVGWVRSVWEGIWGHGLVERHFEGRGGRQLDRRMWRHLRLCEDCRVRYRSHALLEAVGRDGEDHARERMSRAIFPTDARTPSRRRTPRLILGGLIVAAGAVVLVPRLMMEPRMEGRVAERGGGTVGGLQGGVGIFRSRDGATPQRAGTIVRAGDALAFTYVNAPGLGARHLMIFARDSQGRVYWYWPAWRDPGANPTSIPVAVSTEAIELGQAVTHPLAPGSLTLYALFSDQPHDVQTVEAMAVRDPTALTRLATHLVVERLEVVP